MKTWMWIVLGVIVLGIIIYAAYVNSEINKAKIEAEKNQVDFGVPGYKPRTSKLAEILDSLTPFLVLWPGGGNNNGGNGNGGSTVECDPNRPGYDINGFPQTECGFGA